MRRLHIMLVTNPACEEYRVHEMLGKMGHLVSIDYEVGAAMASIKSFSHPKMEAVVIDGFPIEDAELIALEIRVNFERIYIGILSSEVKYRVVNEYADEIIPKSFMSLRDALSSRFSEAI